MEQTDYLFLFFQYLVPLIFLSFSAWLIFDKKFDGKVFEFSKKLFFTALGVYIFKGFFFTVLQYYLWQGSYFLPPFQPWNYFFEYAWLHFWKQIVFDVFLAFFFFSLIRLGTYFSKGRFFYEEEKYSGGLAVLFNHWPNNLLVFFLVLAFGIVFSVFENFFLKKLSERNQFLVNFRYFWPIVGLLIIFLGNYLVKILGFNVLRI